MTKSKLHLTIVECSKLKHRVGQGNVSPYQVLIIKGEFLGFTGQVIKPGEQTASNQEIVDPVRKNRPSRFARLSSWLRS